MTRQGFRQLIAAVLLTALASGCGGGGGSGGESPAQDADAAVPTPAAPPPAETPPVGAAAIEVPEGFDFATSKPLPVNVALNVSAKAYLTICESDAAGVDYERCLLRTALDGGRYDGELLLPNHIDSLTATVWTFDPAAIAHAAAWQRPGDDLGVLRIR